MRNIHSPIEKLPQRSHIAMSSFTALQMQHTCGLQAKHHSCARFGVPLNLLKHPLCCPCLSTTFPGASRYHRSTFSVSYLRAESRQPLRQGKQTYGSRGYEAAANSQQASPQTSLVRRHLLSSVALIGLLSGSTPVAWAQEQPDAPQPVQATKDLIAGRPMHTLTCALVRTRQVFAFASLQGALEAALLNTDNTLRPCSCAGCDTQHCEALLVQAMLCRAGLLEKSKANKVKNDKDRLVRNMSTTCCQPGGSDSCVRQLAVYVLMLRKPACLVPKSMDRCLTRIRRWYENLLTHMHASKCMWSSAGVILPPELQGLV